MASKTENKYILIESNHHVSTSVRISKYNGNSTTKAGFMDFVPAQINSLREVNNTISHEYICLSLTL